MRAGRGALGHAGLAAAFAPAVVCLAALNNVILANRVDLPYQLGVVLVFLGAFVLLTVLGTRLFLHAPRARWAELLARGWIGVGCAALVFDAAGASARNLGWSFTSAVLVDEAAALGVALLSFLTPFGLLRTVAEAAAALILAHAAYLHVAIIAPEANLQHTAAAAQRTAQGPASLGNVYHIILDAFQSEAYLALTRGHPELAVPDATYYPRFFANYPLTQYSLPSLLGGEFYATGESLEAWQREAVTDGLWQRLAGAGVGVHLYPHFPGDCAGTAGRCRPTLAPRPAQAYDLVDLWFLSILPHSTRTALNGRVSNAATADAGADSADAGGMRGSRWFSITQTLHLRSDVEACAAPTAYAPLAVGNFDRLLAEEAARPPRGQYVFAHLALPHGPYLVDKHCECIPDAWTARDRNLVDAYMGQAQCGLRLVRRLVERLQALDRYADSLIIVHGDHGMDPALIAGFAQAYDDSVPDAWFPHFDAAAAARGSGRRALIPLIEGNAYWTPGRIAYRSRTLLVVKPSGQAPDTADPRPTQMIDLAPTILAHFDIRTDDLPGRPLQAPPPDESHSIHFFAALPRPGKILPPDGRFDVYAFEGGAWTLTGTLAARP